MGGARGRRRAAAVVVLSAAVALFAARRYLAFGVTLARSTGGFVASSEEPRVLHEPGAEAEAARIAAALPQAVATVERALQDRFAKPVAVYVCATTDSFARFTGGKRAAGTTLGGRLFLAPKLSSTPERIPKVLAHELTHLYFEQREGVYAFARSFPPWLAEGVAVWASDGGGAEGVTEADAAHAIREGNAFVPTVPGLLPAPVQPAMDSHTFYRQSGMFVGYLAGRDPAAFHRLLGALAAGEPLASAFPAAYRADVDAAWRDFVRGLGDARP